MCDKDRPQLDFQRAILHSVEQITHIAVSTTTGEENIVGGLLMHMGSEGVPGVKYGLCMGVTKGMYVTTTEVYPDSPKSNPEICILAQVAVVTSGLDYVLAQ